MLESLLALSVFAMIVTLLLSAVNQGRKVQIQDYQQQEVLNVAKIAVQTERSELSLNGVEVRVQRDSRQIAVYHDEKEILRVEKK